MSHFQQPRAVRPQTDLEAMKRSAPLRTAACNPAANAVFLMNNSA